MTYQQKRAAATISFAIVVIVAVLLTIFAVQVGGSSAPLGRHFAGRQLLLLSYTRSALEILLEALPAIVSIGLSIVAGTRLKDWQYYATVAITVIGVFTCIYLVMDLSDPEQAKRLWAYSPVPEIDSYTTFTAATRPFLVAIGAWFITVLGIQLGVMGTKQTQGAAAPPSPAPPPATPPPSPPPAAPDAPPAPDQPPGRTD